MDLIHPQVQAYAEKYTSPDEPLLREICDHTLANHPHAGMLSGHLQGKWLQMVSWMLRPRRILEIGTFTGYSGLCLAAGLTEDGLLHTIDIREEETGTAAAYFARSAFGHKIRVHTGDAREIIPALDEQWDLVFIDADKTGYIEYFNLVFPRLRQNGFILADNVFFHGDVLEEPVKGKSGKAIRDFNEYILGRNDLEKMMLTLRDGLYLLRKI
ncbi:MAG: O-methyltransferase [Chitinophagaceae bacterium]|nr:MAG: O-methyltransferase [Chitinophagaceae bacterium]